MTEYGIDQLVTLYQQIPFVVIPNIPFYNTPLQIIVGVYCSLKFAGSVLSDWFVVLQVDLV